MTFFTRSLCFDVHRYGQHKPYPYGADPSPAGCCDSPVPANDCEEADATEQPTYHIGEQDNADDHSSSPSSRQDENDIEGLEQSTGCQAKLNHGCSSFPDETQAEAASEVSLDPMTALEKPRLESMNASVSALYKASSDSGDNFKSRRPKPAVYSAESRKQEDGNLHGGAEKVKKRQLNATGNKAGDQPEFSNHLCPRVPTVGAEGGQSWETTSVSTSQDSLQSSDASGQTTHYHRQVFWLTINHRAGPLIHPS